MHSPIWLDNSGKACSIATNMTGTAAHFCVRVGSLLGHRDAPSNKHLLQQAFFETQHGVNLGGDGIDFGIECGEGVGDLLLFFGVRKRDANS